MTTTSTTSSVSRARSARRRAGESAVRLTAATVPPRARADLWTGSFRNGGRVPWLRLRAGTAQVGFEVDDPRRRLRGPDPVLGLVDGARDARRGVVVPHRDLGADEELLRAEVLGPHVDDRQAGATALERGHDPALRLRGGRLPQQQALGFRAEDRGHSDQQEADQDRAEGVEDHVAGDHGQTDAEQREDQAQQGGGVLQQHDRQLGGPGGPDEPPVAHPRRLHRGGLLHRGAQREALQDDRHDQDPDRPDRRRQRLRVLQLVHALVDGEQAADSEQHDRDQEAVYVPVAAEAERVLGGGRPLRPLAADEEQHLVAGVGDRVDRLGEHRRRPGHDPGDELGQRDAEVGQQGVDDRPGATVPPAVACAALLVHPLRRGGRRRFGGHPWWALSESSASARYTALKSATASCRASRGSRANRSGSPYSASALTGTLCAAAVRSVSSMASAADRGSRSPAPSTPPASGSRMVISRRRRPLSAARARKKAAPLAAAGWGKKSPPPPEAASGPPRTAQAATRWSGNRKVGAGRPASVASW